MCTDLSLRHKPGEMTCINVPRINKPEDCVLILKTAIQFILFAKRVIPYPYSILKDIMNRAVHENNMTGRQIMFENLLKKKASAMIMKVDGIVMGLDQELNGSVHPQIREVAFLIGPTINCPKEVYVFKVPVLYPDKSSRIPIKPDMRHLFMNEEFMKFSSKTIQKTNMYVLIKKPKGDASSWICPLPNYAIPQRAPCVIMNLCAVDSSVQRLVNNKENDLRVVEPSKHVSVHQRNGRTDSRKQNIMCQAITNTVHESENTRNLTEDFSSIKQLNDITSNQQTARMSSEAVGMKTLESLTSQVTGKETVEEIKEVSITTTVNEELIWYIASEYLPFFGQHKIYSYLPNKCVKH